MEIMLSISVAVVLMYWIQMQYFKRMILKHVEVSIRFGDKSVREGDSSAIFQAVRNQKRTPMRAVKVVLVADRGLEFADHANTSTSDFNYRSEVYSMNGEEEITREIPIRCLQRGMYRIDVAEVIATDFFYKRFFRKTVHQDASLIVMPGRTVGKGLETFIQHEIGIFETDASIFEDPFLFDGIRDYETYDSFRSINWPATAKTGSLKVNKHAYTSDQQVVILLDIETDTLLQDDELVEESIRIASQVAEELIFAGVAVALYANDLSAEENPMQNMKVGSSKDHLNTINTMLASLETRNRADSLTVILSKLAGDQSALNRERTYILISSQSNEEVVSKWNQLGKIVKNSSWIFPTRDAREIEPPRTTSGFLLWEIENA